LTKSCAFLAAILVLILAPAGHAGEADKNDEAKPLLPPVTFGDNYSVKLDVDKPKASDLDAPPALTPLRDDSFQPFVGLKFTKPLNSK